MFDFWTLNVNKLKFFFNQNVSITKLFNSDNFLHSLRNLDIKYFDK